MVKVDVRKLISFGKGSFIISMPKSWIEKNNLKKGDLLSVNDDGTELVLSASPQDQIAEYSEIDINAKSKNLEHLKAEIVSSYLNGYDTINIIFESNDKGIPKVKDIIRNLSGLEIMEQTLSRITAKNLINIKEISIQNIIRRMDIITRAMIEDSALCCRGHCNYDSIHNRDVDVNRLYYLGYRVIKNAMKNPRIAKSLGVDPWKMHSDALIMVRLEKIADRQKRIARYLCSSNLDRNTLAELEKAHASIGECYNDVMKSYYNKDKALAIDREVRNKEKAVDCDKILEEYTKLHAGGVNKGSNSNLVSVAKIIESLKATAAEVRNIARTVLCYE